MRGGLVGYCGKVGDETLWTRKGIEGRLVLVLVGEVRR